MIVWFQLLGPLGYPLAFCSIVAVALIVERAIYYWRLETPPDDLSIAAAHRDLPGGDTPIAKGRAVSGAIQTALELLSHNKNMPRGERDSLLETWLSGYAKSVQANLKWLSLIAALTPMLGLLGTVLGMTRAFYSIAKYDGPISPSVLADGLWEAMLTTLVGLTIALPTLVALWILRSIATNHLDRVAGLLNRNSLAIDGVQFPAADAANTRPGAAAVNRERRAT